MDVVAQFRQRFEEQPVLLARAPGRVNLLGEHVDYNDGPVLPMAIDRGVQIAARPTTDGRISLSALDLGREVEFDLDGLQSKTDLNGGPLPDWALYPAGVAYALQSAGCTPSGLQAAYTSNLPMGSGLSSSAAVEVAFGVLWNALAGERFERMQLTQLCQQAENEYVGVNCGLMDQFASMFGVQGHALYFDTRSLDWRPLPLPEDTLVVIADSNVPRKLSGSEYNNRREACRKAVEILHGYRADIHSLRDVSPTEFAAYASVLPEDVRPRAEHVVREIARVESAVNALENSDRRAFGALMYAGHASLRDLYEVSTPELDGLVEIAHDLPGCLGARLTGAGFGGCTVNLVEEDNVADFLSGLRGAYRERFDRELKAYTTQASSGAAVKEYGRMES